MKFADIILIHIKFFLSLIVFGLLFIIMDAGSFLINLFLPDTPFRRCLGRKWLAIMSGAGVRYLIKSKLFTCDFDEIEKIKKEKDLIIISNHPSRMDGMILASLLPNAIAVTKSSIWKRYAMGMTLRTAGYLEIKPLNKLFPEIQRSFDESAQLLLFPEGTRSKPGEKTGTFQGGFAIIAQRTGKPVQPVIIESASPYLSQGWPFYKLPPVPMVFKARLDPRLEAPERGPGNVTSLVRTAEKIFTS